MQTHSIPMYESGTYLSLLRRASGLLTLPFLPLQSGYPAYSCTSGLVSIFGALCFLVLDFCHENSDGFLPFSVDCKKCDICNKNRIKPYMQVTPQSHLVNKPLYIKKQSLRFINKLCQSSSSVSFLFGAFIFARASTLTGYVS